jgi:hypothetical protein
MSYPLIQQANSWIGYTFCYIIIMVIYYSNTWNVSFHRKSPSSLTCVAKTDYYQVFGLPHVVYFHIFFEWIDIPPISHLRNPIPAQSNRACGSWPPGADRVQCLGQSYCELGCKSISMEVKASFGNLYPLQIGGLVAHVILFWGPYAVESFKLAYTRTQPDPHYQVLLLFS